MCLCRFIWSFHQDVSGAFWWQKSWAPRAASEAACHDRALLEKPAQFKEVEPNRKKKRVHGYSNIAFSSIRDSDYQE